MKKKTTIQDNPEMALWYEDLYQNMRVSRNRWFLIGVISLLVAGLEAGALIGLTPFKTVEPYVIQVDPETGRNMVLSPLGEKASLTEAEALTKSFIVKYVIARETYDPQDVNRNYQIVRLMSERGESLSFNEEISNANPNSPVNRYESHTRRSIRISSVSFLNKKTAQVRFKATEKSMTQKMETYWVAILSFRYINSPMEEAERFENPLGFQVVSYRTDQEVVK